MRSQAIHYLTLLLLAVTGAARGQFTTVINLPGDPAPTSIAAGTQLNIYEGGTLPYGSDFFASGGEINLLGGQIGRDLFMRGDAVVNVVEGTVIYGLTASEQSEVNILGGTFLYNYQSDLVNRSDMRIAGGTFHRRINGMGESTTLITGGLFNSDLSFADNATAVITGGVFRRDVAAYFDATLLIKGGEFRIDGIAVEGLDLPGSSAEISLSSGQFISGTLADGTPFGFLQTDLPSVPPGRIQLARTVLADVPAKLHVPSDPIPLGLRGGQTLFLGDGGVVPAHFLAGWGSRIVMEGGTLGPSATLTHTNLLVTGGNIGGDLRVGEGSQVMVTGGEFGTTYFDRYSHAELHGGTFLGATFGLGSDGLISEGQFHNVTAGDASQLVISGGTFTNRLRVSTRSHVVIDGGLLRHAAEVRGRGTLVVSGGTFGDSWLTSGPSELRLVGSEFLLDGDPITGLDSIGDSLPFNIPSGATLTGILGDGTPFHISGDDGDSIASGTLTLELTGVPAAAPLYQILFAPSDRSSLRDGQQVILSPGGSLGDYFRAAVGAKIEVNGGSLSHHFEGDGASIVLNTGTIGDYFNGFVWTVLEVNGGSVGNYALLSGKSELEMTGGALGDSVRLTRGSRGTISGGTVGEGFAVTGGSTLEVIGGSFGEGFYVGTQPIQRATEGDMEAAVIIAPSLAVANLRGGEYQDLSVYRDGVANIYPGAVAQELTVGENGTANFYGGELQAKVRVYPVGTLNAHGGVLPDGTEVVSGTLNLLGAAIGDGMIVRSSVSSLDGKLNVFGGEVGDGWQIESNSSINVHGGKIGEGRILSFATATIYGTDFQLLTITPGSGRNDPPIVTATPIEGIEPGVPYLLDARNITLGATLADGSPFELGLFSAQMPGRDYVASNAQIYLVLVQVPEPATLALILLPLAALAGHHFRRTAQKFC